MAPTQLFTQCLNFWKRKIELSHGKEIHARKARAELDRQLFSQCVNESIAIRCFRRTALLFDNHLADEPVRLDHRGIRRLVYIPSRFDDDRTHLRIESRFVPRQT